MSRSYEKTYLRVTNVQSGKSLLFDKISSVANWIGLLDLPQEAKDLYNFHYTMISNIRRGCAVTSRKRSVYDFIRIHDVRMTFTQFLNHPECFWLYIHEVVPKQTTEPQKKPLVIHRRVATSA